MSSQTFNFGDLSPVERANPVTAASRLAGYRLRRRQTSKGPMFRFSQALFDELFLDTNSVIQYNGIGSLAGKVFLGVVGGNTGSWLKSKTNRRKGKEHKNVMLDQALNNAGITQEYLDLVHVGYNEGVEYYQIIPDPNHPDNQTNEDSASGTATEVEWADRPVGDTEDNL